MRIIPAAQQPRLYRGRFWLVTIAALLVVLATASLGRWQLSRAAQKQALHDAIETRRTLPPLHNAELLAQREAPAELLHRPVELRGRFVPDYTVFLDNRQMHGRPGFYVLTPMLLEHSNTAVLVQRGWIVRNFVDRAALPELATPTGPVRLIGRIAPVPPKLFEFEGVARERIRQNLDFADYRNETRLDLVEFSVLQTAPEVAADSDSTAPISSVATGSATPAESRQLMRDWPQASSGVETHFGYAFQWFGLSALIACLYVWYQFIAPRRSTVASAATD